MPILRSGFSYGEDSLQVVQAGLDLELKCCYHEHERFNKTSKRFGLVFLDVPSTSMNINSSLSSLPHKHKPEFITSKIIDNGDGTCCIVAVLTYQKRVNATRCAYFSLNGIVPFVCRNTNKLDEWMDRTIKCLNETHPALRLSKKTLNDRTPIVSTPKVNIDKQIPESGSILICGKQGIGKTSLAKCILRNQGLVVENIQRDLVKFNPSKHSGIIFENVDFRGCDDYSVQGLIIDADRKIKYNNIEVFIPKGIRIIFTMRSGYGVFNSKAKCIKSMVTRLNIK